MQALEKHTDISNSLSIVDISRVKRSCFLALKRSCFLASTQTIYSSQYTPGHVFPQFILSLNSYPLERIDKIMGVAEIKAPLMVSLKCLLTPTINALCSELNYYDAANILHTFSNIFFPFPQWVGNKITLNNYKPEIFELEIHTLVQSSHFTDKRTQIQISELFIQD